MKTTMLFVLLSAVSFSLFSSEQKSIQSLTLQDPKTLEALFLDNGFPSYYVQQTKVVENLANQTLSVEKVVAILTSANEKYLTLCKRYNPSVAMPTMIEEINSENMKKVAQELLKEFKDKDAL